jgi:hypothetical protein
VSSASLARVPTGNGSRYLQQLCKHWSHNLQVQFDPSHGRVIFPAEGKSGSWQGEGIFTMTASDTALECRIEASEEGQLEALKGVVERHLDRFAFREAPLSFDWQEAA